MTIELGWWLLPLFITNTAFIWAKYQQPERTRDTYLPDVMSPMIGVGLYLIATIMSLLSWLIWALAI